MHAAALAFESTREMKRSFDDIVREQESQVLRTAFRMLGNWADAEDVAQETFFRLHRRGLAFDTEASLGAWVYRVAINLCLDRLRSVRPSAELPDVPSADASAESAVIRAEQQKVLRNALATLPAKERAAVTLREIEGLSTAEVAAILGSTEGTVRSQVSTAITRLREVMKRRSR